MAVEEEKQEPYSTRNSNWREVKVAQGSHLGDRYVKYLRRRGQRVDDDFEVLETDSTAIAPSSGVGKFFRFLFGQPLRSSEEGKERLAKPMALALLSTDAIASIAYATEQIVRTLAVAGVAVVAGVSMNIAIIITVLLLIVSFSYRQTIQAYPQGGGSYTVSRENLGTTLGLTAGAALMIDYILNAAVSISAGVAAIVSAFPSLFGYKVWLAMLFLLIITVVNLRGLRESGVAFAAPTYAFIISIVGIIIVGLIQLFAGNYYTEQASNYSQTFSGPAENSNLFLLLLAFSSGCTAMTGIEAISNGVPVFKKPEVKNALTVMNWMTAILAVLFLGVTYLAQQFKVLGVNDQQQTVIDQLARHAYGTGPFYVFFVVATTTLLTLAAQTSFSGLPRVTYVLANDGYLPKLFAFRGERLAFNAGIMALAVVTALLLLIFKAETNALIPLFAIGAFLSFTLSQAGMVTRWLRRREVGWRRGVAINGLGAIATGIALAIIAITKFNSEEGSVILSIGDFKLHEGAWIVVVVIPLMVMMFRGVQRHYAGVARELNSDNIDLSDPATDAAQIRHIAVVPISALNQITVRALAYAHSFAGKVTAVHVTDDVAAAAALHCQWEQFYADSDIHLVVLESPYRALIRPLLSYIEDVQKRHPDYILTVVLPDFVAQHWWEHVLHTQTALRLKAALLFQPNIVVTSVPYQLKGKVRAAK